MINNIKNGITCNLVVDSLNTSNNIDFTKYDFVYYEYVRDTGLVLVSNYIPVKVLTPDVKEFNHAQYVNGNYNLEVTTQVSNKGIKGYVKTQTGWVISKFKVYGIKL